MKVRFEEGLPCRLGASAFGFDGHKDRVDLGKRIGVVGLQHPTPIALAVHVKDAEADGLRRRSIGPAPCLEGLGFAIARLSFQIEGIEDHPSLLAGG